MDDKGLDKFKPGDTVLHKNGGFYMVIRKALYEPNCTSVYVYQSLDDGRLWVRPLKEMEDGRFTLAKDVLNG